MTSSTGSISLSGLLGGTAGSIDTTTLISQLMAAAAVPQNQLEDQLTTLQQQLMTYQTVNTKTTALQSAAQNIADPTTWQATKATSSSANIVATASSTASPGDTTFSVTQLAKAQITTTMAAADGTVVSNPSAGISIYGADGTEHDISLTSGSATDVATAINAANVGVRASVVTTSDGTQLLQMQSTSTGAANAFTTSDFDNPTNDIVTAQDAQITVGDDPATQYTVSSSSNTFSNFIPGVTFSANALVSDATISVAQDESGISSQVNSMVTAANSLLSEISGDTAQGAVLQGKGDVRNLFSALLSSVSAGTANGGSLSDYGITITSAGAMTFDATKFASAYAADPTGTQSVLTDFANTLNSITTDAVDPSSGTITSSINTLTSQSTNLNTEISNWTDRLNTEKDSLTAKFTAMETALAKLQSQQTYLTQMFDKMNGSSSSSSS